MWSSATWELEQWCIISNTHTHSVDLVRCVVWSANSEDTVPAKIITDVKNKNKFQNNRSASNYEFYRFILVSKTINPHQKYRRYRYYRFLSSVGSWSVVRGAHIQAFTISSQDHGRLPIVRMSKHSCVWCVCNVCVCVCVSVQYVVCVCVVLRVCCACMCVCVESVLWGVLCLDDVVC